MTQLVGDGECEREPSVLVDAAAAVGLTHACHMRQTQRLTGLVDGCTDILPVKRRGRTGRVCDRSNNNRLAFYSLLILSHMFYRCTTTKNSYLRLKGEVRKKIALHANSNSKCFKTESLSSRLTLVSGSFEPVWLPD